MLERAYEHIRGEEQKLRLTDLPPVDGVTRLVEFTWNYYLAHPEFMTLLNSENLHRAQHLKRSRKIRAMHSPLIATLSRAAATAARARASSAAASTRCSSTSRSPALGYFYLSNNHTLSTIFGRDLMAARAKAARLAHIKSLVLGYLAQMKVLRRVRRRRYSY